MSGFKLKNVVDFKQSIRIVSTCLRDVNHITWCLMKLKLERAMGLRE